MSVDDGYICAPEAEVAFRWDCGCNVRPSAVMMRRRRFSLTIHPEFSESRRVCNLDTPSEGCWFLRDRTADLRASSGGEIGVVLDILYEGMREGGKRFHLPDLEPLTRPVQTRLIGGALTRLRLRVAPVGNNLLRSGSTMTHQFHFRYSQRNSHARDW